MKDKVLAVVTSKENNDYIGNFKKVVSNTSPQLLTEQLLEIYREKPIIGQVLKGCFGYEKVFSLERLDGIDQSEENWWLVTKHINGNYGLGIGSKNDDIEIFLEDYGKPEERYYLRGLFPPYETTGWIRPSKNFLQETLLLLPEKFREEFKDISQ